MSASTDTGTASPPAEERLLTHKTITYRLVRRTVQAWLFLVNRLRVRGRENVPRSGGALIVCNHQSYLDIPTIAASTRRHVSFVARDSLAETRWLAFVMRECGAVLVRRGAADRRALREMTTHLARGDCLAIFPEGTRSADGTLGEFRGGALVAARKTGVPIVPAAIRGAIEAWPRHRRRPCTARISLEYGPPIDAAAPDALERVRAAIEGMLGDGRFPRD